MPDYKLPAYTRLYCMIKTPAIYTLAIAISCTVLEYKLPEFKLCNLYSGTRLKCTAAFERNLRKIRLFVPSLVLAKTKKRGLKLL